MKKVSASNWVYASKIMKDKFRIMQKNHVCKKCN